LTFLTRALLPAVAVAVTLIVTTAGCGSSGSATASGTTTAAALASASPSLSISASVSQPSLQPASPSASAVMTVTLTPPVTVYFAEGGDVNGTAMQASACAAGCPLSGDGTTSLWDMTWPTWNPAEAVGTGTEKIDDCNPSCATGKLYPVKVAVTFRDAVTVCIGKKTARLYWTRASFSWPDGLPAVFSGENAPVNPVKYANIAAQSTSSCALPTSTGQ
jgi:hypothetical protein